MPVPPSSLVYVKYNPVAPLVEGEVVALYTENFNFGPYERNELRLDNFEMLDNVELGLNQTEINELTTDDPRIRKKVDDVENPTALVNI